MCSPHESQGEFLPPPMPTMPMPESGHTHSDLNILSITEDEAREAFIKFASRKCCYSSSPARDGVITRMEAFNTYRYRLKTFSESRSTEWSQEPYIGMPHLSCDRKRKRRRPCQRTCQRPRCHVCRGLGYLPCCKCQGRKRIVVYVVLEVNWTSHTDVYVVEQNSGLKVDHLRKVSGKKILKDTQTPMVHSLRDFPDPAVVEASERLTREHHANYHSQTSRIRQQRQTIELIPITRVGYMWEEKSFVYFVFGKEFKVSSEDYPAKCCCCSVL
ncbi:protein SSUH2 homolog [Clupea harengus]|uniref:Protein SSUH2 homolog n=1 Tax=Clupea harengus TaxID=7950 RepID=A0A8M1KUD0_CLUHA|nr:protein SSUH2 homolog [Clupea harengus]